MVAEVKILVCAVSSFTAGLTFLATYAIKSRISQSKLYAPLFLFFFVLGNIQVYFLIRGIASVYFEHPFSPILTLLKQVIELNMAPLFWLYIRGITSQKPTMIDRRDLKHFTIPLLLALFLTFSSLLVDLFAYMRPLIDVKGVFSARLNEVLNGVIFIQLLIYGVLVIRRMKRSHHQIDGALFDEVNNYMFVNFKWLCWLILSTIGLELVFHACKYQFGDAPVIDFVNFILRASIIWSFCAWGVYQKAELLNDSSSNLSEDKYKKSGLSEKRLLEVSEKIKAAFEEDSFYRQPDISLASLSARVGVLPNYVSQALNLKLGEPFFDYVNRLRVNDALLRLEHTNDTVLKISIDVGFNSRSSFYSAFKKVTGVTPSLYRDRMSQSRIDAVSQTNLLIK